MKLTIPDLLHNEIIWNKEQVVIIYNDEKSEMKRLEFHYDAIDNSYRVVEIEPNYDKVTQTAYLVITCD